VHVVRGQVLRGEGRVRVEAVVSDGGEAMRRGPFAGEAAGDDAAAVAAATRTMLAQSGIACRR
jgi:hypothetical protein